MRQTSRNNKKHKYLFFTQFSHSVSIPWSCTSIYIYDIDRSPLYLYIWQFHSRLLLIHCTNIKKNKPYFNRWDKAVEIKTFFLFHNECCPRDTELGAHVLFVIDWHSRVLAQLCLARLVTAPRGRWRSPRASSAGDLVTAGWPSLTGMVHVGNM